MISLDLCMKILKNGEKKYGNEEAKQLREYLYFLASIEMENNKEKLINEKYECNNLL